MLNCLELALPSVRNLPGATSSTARGQEALSPSDGAQRQDALKCCGEPDTSFGFVLCFYPGFSIK